MASSEIQVDSSPNEGHDLSEVLEREERIQLVFLTAKITTLMREQLSETFEFSIKNGKKPQKALSKKDSIKRSEGSEKFNEFKKEELRSHEKRPWSPKISDLKRDALDFFDRWKDSLITRIDDAVKISNIHGENSTLNKQMPIMDQPLFETKVIQPENEKIEADAALIMLYPPSSTALCSLPWKKRLLILQAVLLLLLSLKSYMAPSRVFLLNLISSLHLPLRVLVEYEIKVSQNLLEAVKNMSGSEETQNQRKKNNISRRWKIGLAGVAGAVIVGVTGGLAAPMVAGAIGTVMGGLGLGATAAAGLLGGLAESSVIVGSLFGAYGARMTSKAVSSYAKDVNDFKFIPLSCSRNQESLFGDRRLRVVIAISGWLTQQEDVIGPWHVLGGDSEVFALRWELEALTELGNSLQSMVKSAAFNAAKKEIISRTLFASLMSALWPIALLKVSKIVDNPFSICMNRADKAGVILADAIINKAQGERPVTLIGYSLGARLIYSCLKSLAKRRAFGLVENVVLMGSPVPSKATVWLAMRSVVSGRLINVYSTNDYVLAFLYRTWGIEYGVAGIQEISEVKRVENYDVTDVVNGHLRYQHTTGIILEKIGWEGLDMKEIAKKEKSLKILEEDKGKEAISEKQAQKKESHNTELMTDTK